MDVGLNLVAAVANAIGCPNWTCSGCDGDECYCRQAAEGVIRQMAELGVAKPIYHTANARLIAAAPDMLGVLQYIGEILSEHTLADRALTKQETYTLIINISSAISKATGAL